MTQSALFADFTTEGGTNQYYFNNSRFSGLSAWLTAIGGTFSSPTSGRYYTNSSGNLATVGANVARFDYDPITLASKGLLLEGASTNNYLQSNNFGLVWTTGTGTETPVQNATGPDGVVNGAWTTTAGAGNSNVYSQSAGTAGPNTVSFFAKAGTCGFAFSQFFDGTNALATFFNLTTGAVASQNVVFAGSAAFTLTSSIVKYPNGWYRVSVTGPSGFIYSSLAIGFSDADANNTAANGHAGFLFGAQAEAASFASSYIPTAAGTASRAADSLTATPISTWYNSLNGTLYAAGDSYSNPSNGVGLIDIDDGSNNNRADLRISSSGTMALVVSGGVNQFAPSVADSGQAGNSTGVLSRVAACLSAGDFIYVKDGGTADVILSGSMPVSPSTLRIGSIALGSLPLFGHIQQIGYWPVSASGSRLQTLTSSAANVNSITIPIQTVSGTDKLQLPVNCVVGGNPGPEEKKSGFITDFRGILKGVFGEP